MIRLTTNEANDIVTNHGILLPNGQVFLTKPLGVFKKVYVPSDRYGRSFNIALSKIPFWKRTSGINKGELEDIAYKAGYYYRADVIANLILPAGALVNLAKAGSQKMRASKAICWSLVGVQDRKLYDAAYSAHNKAFIYYPALAPNGSIHSEKEMFKRTMDWCSNYETLTDYSIKRNIILPDEFSTGTRECQHGVHFYVHHIDAVNHGY